MPRLIPGAGRYTIVLEEQSETSEGGLYLPDSGKQKPSTGTIEYVGEGKEREDGTLKKPRYRVGDCVTFGKWSGQEVEAKGLKRFVLFEDDIIGHFEGE